MVTETTASIEGVNGFIFPASCPTLVSRIYKIAIYIAISTPVQVFHRGIVTTLMVYSSFTRNPRITRIVGTGEVNLG